MIEDNDFEMSETDKVSSLAKEVSQILNILGHPEAFITDESRISDMICVFDNEKKITEILDELRNRLDVRIINKSDKIIDVAERVKKRAESQEDENYIKIVDIDLTEEMSFSWPDPEINGWRFYRIEYGGCNEQCYYEGRIILPPQFDSWLMTEFFEIIQVPEALKDYTKAVHKIHRKRVGKLSRWCKIKIGDSWICRLKHWW